MTPDSHITVVNPHVMVLSLALGLLMTAFAVYILSCALRILQVIICEWRKQP